MLLNIARNSPLSTSTQGMMKKDHIYLDIQDTGNGIGVKDLPRIFSKSYTATVGRESSCCDRDGLVFSKKCVRQNSAFSYP